MAGHACPQTRGRRAASLGGMSTPGLPPYSQPVSPHVGGGQLAPHPAGNGMAWASIALAVVITLAQPLVNAVLVGLVSAPGSAVTPADYGTLTLYTSIGYCLLGAIGLLLGILAARRSSRLLSGIGIGANGLVVAGFAINLLMQPLYAVL